MRATPLLAPLLAAWAAAACVVPMGHAPGGGHVAPQTVAALQDRLATRAEILMTLGAPDRRLLDDRVFGYRWSEALAAFVFAAGYQMGGFTVSEKRLLLIEFTPQGTLLRSGVVGGITAAGLDAAAQAWVADVRPLAP